MHCMNQIQIIIVHPPSSLKCIQFAMATMAANNSSKIAIVHYMYRRCSKSFFDSFFSGVSICCSPDDTENMFYVIHGFYLFQSTQ